MENAEILLIAAVALLGIIGMVYSTGAAAPIGVDPAYLELGETLAERCIELDYANNADCCSYSCEDACEGECQQYCSWSCEDMLDRAYMLSP